MGNCKSNIDTDNLSIYYVFSIDEFEYAKTPKVGNKFPLRPCLGIKLNGKTKLYKINEENLDFESNKINIAYGLYSNNIDDNNKCINSLLDSNNEFIIEKSFYCEITKKLYGPILILGLAECTEKELKKVYFQLFSGIV